MGVLEYLHRLQQAELALAQSHRNVAHAHCADPGSMDLFLALAGQSQNHAQGMGPMLERYGNVVTGDVGSAASETFWPSVGTAGATWFFDLQDLYLSVCLVDLAWAVLMPLSEQMKDRELVRLIQHSNAETGKQLAWIKKRIKLASWPAPAPGTAHPKKNLASGRDVSAPATS